MIAVLALLLLQSIQQADRAAPRDDPRLVARSEVVLEQVRVEHADPDALYRLVSELAGRTYFIREHGGLQSDEITSVRRLGDSLVLYDTMEQVQRLRELVARLDVAGGGPPELVAREYAPRYLALDSVLAAARSLVEVSLLAERGKAVLRGTPASVEEALALLARLDQPDAQVMLTCRLLEIADAPGGPALPRELVENLRTLLPGCEFVQVGLAMLKTSVGGGTIALEIETKGKRYALRFTPAAYDAASGALTAHGCALLEATQGEPRELFRTDAVLRAGEHTLLAATGATPRLLVLSVAPQR